MNNEQRISVRTKTGYLKAMVLDDGEHPAIYVYFCPDNSNEEFEVAMIESKQADYDMDTKNMHVYLYEDVNIDDWTRHIAIPIKRNESDLVAKMKSIIRSKLPFGNKEIDQGIYEIYEEELDVLDKSCDVVNAGEHTLSIGVSYESPSETIVDGEDNEGKMTEPYYVFCLFLDGEYINVLGGYTTSDADIDDAAEALAIEWKRCCKQVGAFCE